MTTGTRLLEVTLTTALLLLLWWLVFYGLHDWWQRLAERLARRLAFGKQNTEKGSD